MQLYLTKVDEFFETKATINSFFIAFEIDINIKYAKVH
jgi:hypothetical protein